MAELSLSCPTTLVSGTVLSLEDHENIDSLVHNISEDTHSEVIRDSNNRVSEVNQYQYDGGPLVRRVEINRDGAGQVTSTVERQYDGAGTLIQSLTTTVSRDGSGSVVTITTDEVP
jgi:hypothetical protein